MDGFLIEGSDLRVVGLAVSWANRDAYYMAFTKQNINGKLQVFLFASWIIKERQFT